MAIARIDPPKAPTGGFLRALRGVARFYSAPVETILSAATTKTPKEEKLAYYALPIEVDTAKGTAVAIELPAGKGKAGAVVSARNAYARAAAKSVEEAFRTGVVPLKVPPGYRAAAELAAGFEHEVADALEPAQDEPFRQFDYGEENNMGNMGGFLPPGGMAGFSQMVGASKLALTRGGRGTRRKASGRKRRRKATGRPRKVGRPTRKAAGRKKRGRARLVKGSAAAKRYMASIRRKRKRG